MNTKNMTRFIFLSGFFLIFWIACQQKTNNIGQVVTKKIVNEILDARSTNKFIQPISKTYANLSINNAYKIQSKLSKELSKLYGPISGYKLGYSDSSSLKKNNTSVPAYGPIFKSQIKKSGYSIPASDYQNFSIEQEIVFTIGKTIDKKLSTIDELVSFVKSVHIGFDMSESVFNGPTAVVDFIANGADSKYFVIGEGLDPLKTDIADKKLSIMYNDSIIYNGTTKNVLGNPWFALRDVVNDLVERGYPLKAGYVVFSGKVAPAYKIQSEKAKGMYKGIGSPFNDIEVSVK